MTPIEVAKRYIRAVQTADQAALASLISDDVVWHQPGKNRFSGTRRGAAAVFEMIGGMMMVSAGTFAIDRATSYLQNDDWVAVGLEFSAQRNGLKLGQPGIDLLRIEAGKIVEARLFSSDQDAEDEFWGS